MGGGSSSSSSSTQQSTTTNNNDRRIGAADNAVVIASEGAPITYTETSKESLDLVNNTLAGVKDSFDKTLEHLDKNTEATQKALEDIGTSNQTMVDLAKIGALSFVGYKVLERIVK